MNIYIHYEICNQPWGGINSFFKSLREYITEYHSQDITLVDSFKKCDIFLMGAGSLGQGKLIDYQMIRSLIEKRNNIFNKVLKNNFKLVHRLDGLRSIYNNFYDPTDDLQIRLAMLADNIIFQSDFSLDNFKRFGYKKNNYTIIYNGVNQRIFNSHNKKFYKDGKLKILSVNWSCNPRKGYKVIADFSENPQVESCFVGNWNNEIDKKNVKVIPPLQREELVKYYKEADIFLHAAENDPCPNVVLEAMSCGLPIIYHNSGGTREIASEYGIALPQEINNETINNTIVMVKKEYNYYLEKLLQDKKNFSINTAAEKYLSYFKLILNQ